MYESNMTMPASITATGFQISNTPDVSVISSKMALIQKLIAESREVQSLLGQRLHAVLRPCPPETASVAQNGNPRMAASPLVDDLEQFAVAIQQLTNGYQDVLNRLEL